MYIFADIFTRIPLLPTILTRKIFTVYKDLWVFILAQPAL